MSFARLGSCFSIAVAACGGGGDGFTTEGEGESEAESEGAPVAVSLEIAPPDATITASPGAGATQAYTAIATFSDGGVADVTAEALFDATASPVGEFQGATFVPNGLRGGHVGVQASYGGVASGADLTVRFTETIVVPGAPKDAPSYFGGPDDPARAPAFAYPESGVVVPPNLMRFEYQWQAGGNDLFELRFANDYTDVAVYTTAASWQADPTAWSWIAETNRGLDVSVGLRGTSAGGGAGVGTAAPVTVGFSLEDLRGGLYYWTTTAQGIIRYDFGDPDAPAESFYTPAESGGRCVACHVLTRDGTKMAFTFSGGNQPSGILDVASQSLLADSSYSGNFQTYDPDGAYLVSSFDGALTLRDGSVGTALGTLPTSGWATHPDWSPDGGSLVYVMTPAPSSDWTFGSGSIVTMSWDGAMWGAPAALVPGAGGGENDYYPSFSPDGEWVVFNRSTGDAYFDGDARVFAIRLIDAAVFELARANGPAPYSSTNSWPRWSPFVQADGTKGTLLWFTFSSTRAYGNQLPAGARPQIWMSAFDPGRAEKGEDPSLPAFWLPFQDIATNNHIAQWTEKVVDVD